MWSLLPLIYTLHFLGYVYSQSSETSTTIIMTQLCYAIKGIKKMAAKEQIGSEDQLVGKDGRTESKCEDGRVS